MRRENTLTSDEKKLVPILVDLFETKSNTNRRLYGKEICTIFTIMRDNGEVKYGGAFNILRLQKLINYIRYHEIAPICSCNDGYWMASNDLEGKIELIATAESLERRTEGIKNAAGGLRAIAMKM
jgi:hypothetical protein